MVKKCFNKAILVGLVITVVTWFMPAAAEAREWTVGGVFFTSLRPQVSAERQENLVPFIGYEGERFYIRGLEAGYEWGEWGGIELSLISSVRMETLSEDDSEEFEGIEHRRRTGEAGLRLGRRIGLLQLRGYFLHDLLNRHGGFEAGASLSSRMPAPRGWWFGSLSGRYQDSGLVGHYFAVNQKEADQGGMEVYSPSGEYSWSAGAGWMSRGMEPLYFQIQGTYHKLGSESRSSPITESDDTVTGMLIVGYRLGNEN